MQVDLRSDTVTRPSAEMRQAMAEAEVGDDVYGEDPTVRKLERAASELLGKDRGLFVASGTQANLVALLTHCQRGEEYIVARTGHSYVYEAGGGAVLGGLHPWSLETDAKGRLDPNEVAGAIHPDDPHHARSRLLCLENSFLGRAMPLDYTEELCRVARRGGLATHLDGARLFNAAVALGVEPATVAEPFDSVSFCLSKGLGAPVGSVLCGSAEWIAAAYRWRKILGGAMRQSGVLAAAGLVALGRWRSLSDDHDRARKLGDCLGQLPGVSLVRPVETNMVWFDVSDRRSWVRALKERDVLVLETTDGLRAVTHTDFEDRQLEHAIAQFQTVAEEVA